MDDYQLREQIGRLAFERFALTQNGDLWELAFTHHYSKHDLTFLSGLTFQTLHGEIKTRPTSPLSKFKFGTVFIERSKYNYLLTTQRPIYINILPDAVIIHDLRTCAEPKWMEEEQNRSTSEYQGKVKKETGYLPISAAHLYKHNTDFTELEQLIKTI